MRLSLLMAVLGLVASAPAFAAVPERVPVVHVDRDHVYVAWSAEDGAHEGCRAELIGPDGLRSTPWPCLDEGRDHGARPRVGAPPVRRWTTLVARPLETAAALSPSGTLSVPLFADPATLDPARRTNATRIARTSVVARLRSLVGLFVRRAPALPQCRLVGERARSRVFRASLSVSCVVEPEVNPPRLLYYSYCHKLHLFD